MNAIAVCQLLVIEMLCEKIGFELHLHLPLSETILTNQGLSSRLVEGINLFCRSQAPQVSECNTEH